MQLGQWDVVILKPTRVFISFLASQLPHAELPSLRALQNDNTAYVIPRHYSDEETFNEIERHFATMFRYEIEYWLGEEAQQKIQGSFLDFLCCFKFELHSQLLIMEPSLQEGKQLLRVRPRSVLLKWLKSTWETRPDLAEVIQKINLSHLTEDATVIVKNFSKYSEANSFLELYYRFIFEAEMLRMVDKSEDWPLMNTYQTFSYYFSVEKHSRLVHLH